jgi:REP element-mobilizing transposase RayT
LLGDKLTNGPDYDQRKDWLLEMLTFLATIFSIDILKYAIMDNHLHLILRNRPDLVQRWSKAKVLRRAMKLFAETFRRRGWYVEPDQPLPKQLLENETLIEVMRDRLSDISWLMKVLQERIARRANQQDGVTGHFWAGRYKSERLLDDAAVLACSMYIDLNWIRAKKADLPEKSRFTSAYDRIRGLLARRRKRKGEGIKADGFLAPLNVSGDYPREDLAEKDLRASDKGIFEMTLEIYLNLLDIVGRMLRTGKRGAIPDHLASILERLGIRTEYFADCVETYDRWARRMVGAENKLRQAAEKIKQKWLQGVSKASHFFTGTTAPAAF